MEQNDDFFLRLETGYEMYRRTMDPSLLRKLAEEQKPFVAILSCSDSRVDPVKAFNLSLGSAFVVRNVGNSALDPYALGSLEYAVSCLGVKAIVVLGHTDCGAVTQSFDCERCDCLEPVVRDIEAVRSSLQGLASKDPGKIAEANVRLQLRRLRDNSCLIRDEISQGKLVLLGAMMDLPTGKVRFV